MPIGKTLLLTFFLLVCTALKAQNFKEEEVLLNTENGEIGGVILFPENANKKVPVVLIIQGSGPTDKDGNSAALPGKNNSLKLLAEALAENGIASLRYDKRGMGLSKKAGKAEEELSFDDFIADASEFLNYLIEDKRFKKVGIAGHSQGSLIGMKIAQGKDVKAFASIAGPSLPIDETLKEQFRANPYNPPKLLEEANTILASLKSGEQVQEVSPFLQSVFRPSIQPFMISWMKYEPTKEISKLNMPILVINGSTDLQVNVEDAQRLQISNPKAKLVIVDGMNHVLKDSSAKPMENNATYSNPDLPLNTKFRKSVCDFFVENLKK
ncbi:hypothetical protein BXY85_4009 [Roseivirga pacifica]|uniref:Serine aminopeptidase S33 domain-containing protein n=1 Tax=Roseivirga pacifica TaxID=1267423 RepID=A0A1I0Q0K5_9BACT|nr:alpha/beta fold hydrolase [Roseivirga pacifica]RKQ43387.1 hypothetical protein BXY85_4009 [Roseivirga pacifica]SEW20033.1 hypothetical protein SAMN05216290_1866 [Roseivirga pacifica]